MQAFNREISEKYDLDIKNITPSRDFFVINTSKGKNLLKKIELSPERIMFIHSAKEHLYLRGFTQLDRFLCTRDDCPFIMFEGDYFVLSDVIEGRECNFGSREEISGASRLLGEMHKASYGFVPPPDCKSRDELGKLPLYFSKRLDEIKKLRKVAKKGRSSFDYLYLDYIDYFCRLGEESVQELEGQRYQRLVDRARSDGTFCHHDYTHHNLLVCDGRMSVTNFNYCCFELKTYDLANLIRRKMRKCGWSIPEGKLIIDQYRSVEQLCSDDFYIMKLMLKFPHKFWRVANRFYNSRRSWSEKSYVLKLKEVISEIEPHKRFMERYDEIIG